MKNDFIKLIILFKVDIKYQFPNKKITWLIQNEKLMNIKFVHKLQIFLRNRNIFIFIYLYLYLYYNLYSTKHQQTIFFKYIFSGFSSFLHSS